MRVFIDFEASSLGKHSYPIEVGWIFEDGQSEGFLIRPASAWTDWDPAAEAIHRISRAVLVDEGVSHEMVARRMLESLTGHDLLASAPSWDGKWLSKLLRAAGYPRHSLRLRDSDDAQRDVATEILAPLVPAARLPLTVFALLQRTDAGQGEGAPVHRALADAMQERRRWLAVRAAASALAAKLRSDGG